MVKDRLQELKQFRNKNDKKETKTAESSIDNAEGRPESENKKLRKTFEQADAVGQWIEQIEKNNQDVRQYLQKLDDTKYNQKDVQEKLQSIFQNNTSIAHRISAKLKQADEEMSNIKSETAEGRIKMIQHTSLKTRFQQVFQDNNQLLENYGNIQKQGIKAQLQAKGCRVTDEELTSLLDEGGDLQIFTDNIIAETAEAKRILASVEERHQQLLQIERMLAEVRDLFLQMSILVDSQQDVINRIEFQAQQASDFIGRVDLRPVRDAKRRYLKRKCYLFLIISLVIVIIVLIFFYK